MTRNQKTRAAVTGLRSSEEYLDLTIPYFFSELARGRQENLLPGDYITIRGFDEAQKYELMEIFPRFGSCKIRLIGHTETTTMPWSVIIPYKPKTIRSNTVMRAIGNWLFGGNRVYRLSEPDRMLKTIKIHWDRQTSDVEDEQGRVYYDILWDDLEFWHPVDYHLPDDD